MSLGPAEILVLAVVLVVLVGPGCFPEAAGHPGPGFGDERRDLEEPIVADVSHVVVATPGVSSLATRTRGGLGSRVGVDGPAEGSA